MDVWMYGWMNGQTDGWKGGWIHKRMEKERRGAVIKIISH